METITSSTIPSGLAVEWSASCQTIVVFLNEPWRLSFSMVSLVITLMTIPRSIRLCGTISSSLSLVMLTALLILSLHPQMLYILTIIFLTGDPCCKSISFNRSSMSASLFRESRRLYREAQLAYIISDEKNPSNHPIYAVDINFGACILQMEES